MASVPGLIGLHPYTRNINKRIQQLDEKFAINNQYTPIIGDYSGLRGGSRFSETVIPSHSSIQAYIPGDSAMVQSSGSSSGGVMRRGRPRSTAVSNMVMPTNGVYPSAINVGGFVKRSYKKGSKSITRPGDLDFTTKRGDIVHHISGKDVYGLPNPYSQPRNIGGKLKKINFKKIGSSIKKAFQPVAKGATKLYNEAKPTLRTIGKTVAPAMGTIGSELGSAAGATLATALDNPELAPIAAKIGSKIGQSAGEQLGKKMSGGKKKSTVIVKGGINKRQARGQLISKLMKQHKMSLGEASKHIKDNKLM
jgi:hypothetical protein